MPSITAKRLPSGLVISTTLRLADTRATADMARYSGPQSARTRTSSPVAKYATTSASREKRRPLCTYSPTTTGEKSRRARSTVTSRPSSSRMASSSSRAISCRVRGSVMFSRTRFGMNSTTVK
jgi:hypothetical protein